jgi:hypothetical protein
MGRPRGTTGTAKEPRDPRKQVHNVNAPVSIRMGEWRYGHCSLVTEGGVTGFVFDELDDYLDTLYHVSLPTNFFSTELLDVDINDCEGMRAFISEWGAPRCPYPGPTRIKHLPEHMQGISDSKKLSRALEYEYTFTDSETGEDVTGMLAPESISLREASLTLKDFQDDVRYMFRALDGVLERHDIFRYGIIRCAASSPLIIHDSLLFDEHEHESLRMNDGSFDPAGILEYELSTAIANQIIETIADPAPWYPCAACGRWFKRKRGAKRPSSSATVCQSNCRPPNKSRDTTRNNERA